MGSGRYLRYGLHGLSRHVCVVWSTASEERDGRVFHVDCEKRAGLASGLLSKLAGRLAH
jgi:hypothetical protein